MVIEDRRMRITSTAAALLAGMLAALHAAPAQVTAQVHISALPPLCVHASIHLFPLTDRLASPFDEGKARLLSGLHHER